MSFDSSVTEALTASKDEVGKKRFNRMDRISMMKTESLTDKSNAV
jgi:hypothetical protein